MKRKTSFKGAETGQARWIVIIAALILIPMGFAVALQISPTTTKSSDDFLEKPDPQYEDCIGEGALYMRFHHWELLRGVREKVVRYGIREEVVRNGNRIEVGLRGCPECHTSRERFCDRCHNAAGLTPDCFGCHYYP
jgi:hypothetical protein